MNNENSISSDSTCEEVANFFYKEYGISEESKNSLIKESISGEILLDIPQNDFKLFGIKGKFLVKIFKYIKENSDKLKQKEINENLSLISNEKNIELFMKKYINYKGSFSKFNLKHFLELKEEEMKNLGLNYGQRKKLIKYIDYFNALEKEKSEKEIKINISIKSSKEEINEFMKNILNFSQNLIDELDFEASDLFSLEEDLIDDLCDNMSSEEKENLKRFVIQKEKLKNCSSFKETPKENLVTSLKEKEQIVQDFNEINLEKNKNVSINEKKLIDKEGQKCTEDENIKKEKVLSELNNNQKKNINNQISRNTYSTKLGSTSSPLEIKYNYNIFFILGIYDDSLNDFLLSAFDEEKNYFVNYIIKIFSYNSNSSDEKGKIFIVQVCSEKLIDKLYISIKKETKTESISYIADLENNKKEIYFHLFYLNFNPDFNKYIYPTKDIIVSELLNTFFCDIFKGIEIFQKSLVNDINNFISQSTNLIDLKVNDILKFIYYCIKTNIEPNLDNINSEIIRFQKNVTLNSEYNITYKNIDNLIKDGENKQKIIELITKIYSIIDIEYMLALIKIENDNYFDKALFNLLKEKYVIKEDFKNLNEKGIKEIQNGFLNIAKNKEDINEIIMLSDSMTHYLDFLLSNIDIICDILENEIKSKSGEIPRNYNFRLSFVELSNETNEIAIQIYIKLIDIVEKTLKKGYQIIDLDNIFQSLVNFFLSKNIDDLCMLNKIIIALKERPKISYNIIEDYYKKVHERGISLIRNKEITGENIIKYMAKQDIFYYDLSDRYKEYRDPEIFEYIQITDHNIINSIINNKIFYQFFILNDNRKEKFYQIILKQIVKIDDFNCIFELFPMKYRTTKLMNLINKKMKELINSYSEVKNMDMLFKIFDEWLISNENQEIDIDLIVKYFVEDNNLQEIASGYFSYLIKNKKNESITFKLKEIIIPFFLQHNRDNLNNSETIISLIKDCEKFRDYILSLLDNRVLKSEDFYDIEENDNFNLFKLFIESCKNMLSEDEINSGLYYMEGIIIQNNITNDLQKKDILYNKINKIFEADKNNRFLNKIKVIIQNEKQSEQIYKDLKDNYQKCKIEFKKMENIIDFYEAFYKKTKAREINLVKKVLNELQNKNISEIIQKNDFFEGEDFNFEEAVIQSSKIGYKYSYFFRPIYEEKKEKINSEQESFISAIDDYKSCLTRIINQKESKEPFFKIEHSNKIIEVIKNKNNKFDKEIEFTIKEFKFLEKDDYIKKNLLNDLINFSKKDEILKLLDGIYKFINIINKIKEIDKTKFFRKINEMKSLISSENLNGEEISKCKEDLNLLGYDINNESFLIKFFKSLKEEALIFIKEIKESKLDIRYLDEFISESNDLEVQSFDIENLFYIYNFFDKIILDDKIKTDEFFISVFNQKFDNDKNIFSYFDNYQSKYGEIKRIYQLYENNPVLTIQEIGDILKKSKVNFVKEEPSKFITFEIVLDKENKIYNNLNAENLRNKILLWDMKSIYNKEQIKKDYINLIDDLKDLEYSLNNLIKSGYPYINNFSIIIINSKTEDENKNNIKFLAKIYKETYINFKNSLKIGYEKYPLLRLFHGKHFIQLFEKARFNKGDISMIIKSVTLNRIRECDINYIYNNKINEFANINNYLEKLLEKKNVNLNNVYEINKVLDNINLLPGLYRKPRTGENNDIDNNNILNIYLNLTNNPPIINTILICNEETTFEKILAFLYNALYCEKQILFILSNLECLELSIKQNVMKSFKYLFKTKRNKKINSFFVLIYKNVGTDLAKEIEKLIPEYNILSDKFLKKPKKIEAFNKVEVYSSEYCGYGKTTEIKCKIRENKANYYYLPIGGCIKREYVFSNLKKLNIIDKKENNSYLHIDLSETDDDTLMNEILFKLIILRYIDSKEEIYYIGNEIYIIIEIPNGFVELNKKYKILNIYKRTHIKTLKPLRLEENAKIINDSPISIVAEILFLCDKAKIDINDIDLNEEIKKNIINEYQTIIDKYFKVENKNFYQKMNFIKILSMQFKKFTNCIDFNFKKAKENNKEFLIAGSRKIIISNLISLSNIFCSSPFDYVLLKKINSKEIFGKYDYISAKEEGINDLSNEKEKKQVFNFEQIKPSLVFFNLDGQSISIITNVDKNQKEYKELKLLWGSNNSIIHDFDPNQLVDLLKYKNLDVLEDLVDYKNLNHESFLNQIKILFSLDKMEIKDLQEICIEHGNYIFVTDNFIKMVRILLNIEAKIPVILMGETGVGKTKLLEMLSILYGKGKTNWKKLTIHAGTTDEDIVKFIDKITEEAIEQKMENETIWIFFDEINTCNSLGLISEIMCKHTYLGKKIKENFIFLGACNPYREIKNQMKKSGLIYYKKDEDNKMNNLVYSVNILPHSLLNFVIDFGSLKKNDEEKYIFNTIQSMLTELNKKIIFDINEKDFNMLQKLIVQSIIICHDFIRDLYDKSSVSLRELRRFGIFFEYFTNFLNDKTFLGLKSSLNITLYLCYYLRLNNKAFRNDLSKKLNIIFEDFLKIPMEAVNSLTRKMKIEKGIALNMALKENLFTCFTCIDNNVPLIIVGKPGTGKSLSVQILFDTLQGEYSENPFFKKKGKLYRYYYQGSEASTSEGIEDVFKKAYNAKKQNKDSNRINLVFFDEMGLAERSSNNPLRIMHYLLEQDRDKSVPFLGISNWRLDAAKINRALNLSIIDYDLEDLEDTAISIAKALDEYLSSSQESFYKILAKTYYEYLSYNKNSLKEFKDFHGNRDFYHLIKNATFELINRKEELEKDEKRTLTEIGLFSLNRNFGGLENSNQIIGIFKNLFKNKYDENVEKEVKFSVIKAIEKNILGQNNRYLMLISETNIGDDIVKYLLKTLKKDYVEMIGSIYKKDKKSLRYIQQTLNKIKLIIGTDTILILKNLDMIYASLYDLFNQNFSSFGNKKTVRIAFEYGKISSIVNKDFHAIIIVNKNQIDNYKLDPPFLNRFEKHIINFEMLLENIDIKIANNIKEYFNLISSFNNHEKLKIDLGDLLINCKLYNIQGLIFKSLKDLENINNYKKTFVKKDKNYEDIITKNVLKKIVPTLCQDIITALTILDLPQKKMSKIILEIYADLKNKNFFNFFQNIQKRKNIIYTFSKATEDIFDEKFEINNNFGTFTQDSTICEMVESFKSEFDLTFLIKQFSDSDNKNLLILRFTEEDLNGMDYINYIIHNYEKEDEKLAKKIILFIVHKRRHVLKIKDENYNKLSNDMSFIDDEYYQIFIDNLKGKDENNILNLIKKNNNELAKEYIYNFNFIENEIFNVLNYLNCQVLYETNDFNAKNYISKLSEKIINNNMIKDFILNNLKEQGKYVSDSIKDIFLLDDVEINGVDFYELIYNKFRMIFSKFLLNIIYFSLEEGVLNPILIEKNYSLLQDNYFINNLIHDNFQNIKFGKTISMKVNKNKTKIYNGFEIPKSEPNLKGLLLYLKKDILPLYIENEVSLRKNIKDVNVKSQKDKYFKNLDRFKNNIKIIMKNKYDLFNAIFDEETKLDLKRMMLEDYLKYFIIKYSENKNFNYKMNEYLLYLLYIIIKVKLIENIEIKDNIKKFKLKYSKDEFIEIILFTQGYNEEIKIIMDVFLDILKYNENFIDIVENIIYENKIKNETSSRNQEYKKIVNISFFKLIESIIRGMLIYSIELFKKNKVKFYEYFSRFVSIEALLQKINRKFYLFSIEIYNLRNIISINETYNLNVNEYEKIINILLQQSIFYYNQDFTQLYRSINELTNAIDEIFIVKNKKYEDLLFFIYWQQYKKIYDEDTRIKILELFFKNKILLKKSKLFLSIILKGLKLENNRNQQKDNILINNFMNFNQSKFKNIINICESIQSNEFNEVLLFFFEGQCQSYFSNIIKKNNNEFSSKCCEELLLELSLSYFKEAVKKVDEYKLNNDNNNILRLYSIAYIKTYCYFYVEIGFKYHDKCNLNDVNNYLKINEENGENNIKKMIIIYILRLYNSKFENYNQFINSKLSISIDKELLKDLMTVETSKEETNYIFKESFISPKNFGTYKDLLLNMENDNLNIDYINNNFDNYYCYIVNNIISFVYGKEQKETIEKMKDLYEKTFENINLGNEGKTLYKYLLNYDLFQEKIQNKISEEDLKQKEFEILLYSFRFVLNTQTNLINNFYNNIIKVDAYKFIQNNYIPGSFPILDEFTKSYYILEQNLKLNNNKLGYYICYKCGYLYEIDFCTFPNFLFKCPNNHDIGGKNHQCIKKDIRVFYNKQEENKLREMWFDCQEWFYSFISITLEEFKEKYVDNKNKQNQIKGIIKDYSINYFEKSLKVRNMNAITFRILNFILYSYLLVSYILNNLKKKEAKNLLVENLFPHSLFGIVKKNWELLNNSLNNLGIENIQYFINMIFDKIIDIINDLKSVSTLEELNNFEKTVDEYITGIINDKENINRINEEYKKINNELINCNKYSIKEIIQSHFDPLIYDQKKYPDIQFYSISCFQDFDVFVNKFNSVKENETKYPLIYLLLNKDKDITKDAINLSNLEPINKLTNILIQIYSYNISREDAKKMALNDKLVDISEKINELYQNQNMNKEILTQEFIEPFLNSWDAIKDKAVQYGCKDLKNPIKLNVGSQLSYFLVDNGEIGFGMYLASAYEQMIDWQNKFINYIVNNNINKGILNSYIPLLEQEIEIQKATSNEILKINENIYETMNNLINSCSMRNIFTSEDKINYKNYNDIEYNYDYIESELGRIILPGIKKFKNNKINFITYLYEGFLGEKTSVLSEIQEKYSTKELSDEEKGLIKNLLEINDNNKFQNEVFSSLQIIMNYILKDYYEPNKSIYDIIDSLPNFVINQKLKEFLNKSNEKGEKIFSSDKILSIYEYIELLCWEQLKNKVSKLYDIEIESQNAKKHIKESLEKNETEKKLIVKQNFTDALRKLISRYLLGTKQDVDINENLSMNSIINNGEFWKKEIIKDKDSFDLEIKNICPNEIKILNSKKLYDYLEGDNYIFKEIGKEKIKNKIETSIDNKNEIIEEINDEQEIGI